MQNWEKFYDFLNNLKRYDNIPVLEAIEKGVSVLFETATVAQTLKGRAKKNPFFAYEQKYVKSMLKHIMTTEEYHFPETGDTRNPYEYMLDSKFMDTFINWAAWQIVNDVDNDEALEEVQEIADKIRYIDPNQIDMFGYDKEDLKTIYKTQIEKASIKFLKENKDEYEKAVKNLLYKMPENEISNPVEGGMHGGDMAGWGEEEYEAFGDMQYGGDHPFEEEALQAWANYLYDAGQNADILKRFKDPKYHDSSAMSDADSRNEENYEKTIEQVNVEVGREKYEEADEVIEMDKGFSWVDTGRESCSAEARQMGHCGNEYGPDKEPGDELWSLRHGESPSEWESHITVIINGNIIEGKRVIKQIKGNGPKSGNAKPSNDYHPHILKLLATKDSRTNKWIVDGFYTENYHSPSSNFALEDLDENHKKLLYNIRPELFKDVEEMEKV